MAGRASEPLENIDPVQEWEPWQPSAKDPWNLRWAGHLYRRAGFGATLRDLRSAVEAGHEATVKDLFKGDSTADFRALKKDIEEKKKKQDPMDPTPTIGPHDLQASWILVLLDNRTSPLREKMTLFWHNHFATSIAKVQNPLAMLRQNETQRYYALSKFRPLLASMSKDGAMLWYLDSNTNIKGKPNENYAREVMELFSLGVGNYTEKDIQEAARAFTGWHVDEKTREDFIFKADLHDFGPKKVLGKQGNLDGGDIVDILVQQPACARFIVRKLYRYLISETVEAPDKLLEPLAERYRKSVYDTGDLVRTMLLSKHFFSDHAYRQRVKSPVEFVFGTIHAVTFGRWKIPEQPLVGIMEAMGQTLFAPPNVKGWPGGRAWLNTSTVLARHNFTQIAASGQWPENTLNGSALVNPDPDKPVEGDELPEANCDVAHFIRKEKCKSHEETVDRLVDLFVQGPIRPEARGKLIEFLAAAKPDFASKDARIRATAHAIMTMPEYQLA